VVLTGPWVMPAWKPRFASPKEIAEDMVLPQSFPLTMGQSPAYRKVIVQADFHSVKFSPREDSFGKEAGSNLNVKVDVMVTMCVAACSESKG